MAAATTPKWFPMKKYLTTARNSSEMLGLLVYGRKTYELMVPYWPDIAKNPSETKADREFAQTFVSKKKIVFSLSLASAEDVKTRIFVRTFATKYLN